MAQVSRLKREVSPEQLQALYAACQALPVLVATGQQDKLVPPRQVRPLLATSDPSPSHKCRRVRNIR